MKEQSLARSLSMFSIGLGLAELLAPRQVARLIGVSEDNARTLQALGLREIASGLGIMQGNAGYFLWSRVAGDVMDLSLLGVALKSPHSNRQRVNCAISAVAAVTVLDVIAASLCSRSHTEPGWRIQEPTAYRGGLGQGDPRALRSSVDEAMAYQSGHVARDNDESTGRENDFTTEARYGAMERT
jgi:hypothetical protein